MMAKKAFSSVVENNLRDKTPQDAAVAMYAGANADKVRDLKAGQRERIELIDTFEIWPDWTQPRRTLPSMIRSEWDGNPVNLPFLFGGWLGQVGEWRGLVMAVLNGEDIDRPDEMPVDVAALVEIATLASSIRRDGLMNPVSLMKIEGGYQIETGERRWLAFHLLNAITGDSKFQMIPARLVERVDRWRQAAENNTRADLNAVGKARQFAVLLMDLMGWENFAPFHDFEYEQQFYAQVADSKLWRVPSGKSDELLTAMGLKHRTAIQRYRDLLALPGDLWTAADDANCPESVLRGLTDLPYEQAVQVFNTWAATRNVATGDNFPKGKPGSSGGMVGGEDKKVDTFVSKQLRSAKKLPADSLRTRINVFKEMIRQMESILEKRR